MTWHLKDRELEKKLIGIDPDFVESLNESLKLGEHEENSWTYEILFGPYEGCYKFEMHVYDDELEDVPEYDPHDWNEYPKVTPPQQMPLRVEFADKSGTKAFFDDCLREYVTAKRINSPCRFRPWED